MSMGEGRGRKIGLPAVNVCLGNAIHPQAESVIGVVWN